MFAIYCRQINSENEQLEECIKQMNNKNMFVDPDWYCRVINFLFLETRHLFTVNLIGKGTHFLSRIFVNN